jgi:hypothetical protein
MKTDGEKAITGYFETEEETRAQRREERERKRGMYLNGGCPLQESGGERGCRHIQLVVLCSRKTDK